MGQRRRAALTPGSEGPSTSKNQKAMPQTKSEQNKDPASGMNSGGFREEKEDSEAGPGVGPEEQEGAGSPTVYTSRPGFESHSKGRQKA